MPLYEVEVSPSMRGLSITVEAKDEDEAVQMADEQLTASDLLDGATWWVREVEAE